MFSLQARKHKVDMCPPQQKISRYIQLNDILIFFLFRTWHRHSMADGYVPVSYTHLDVYKRQILHH